MQHGAGGRGGPDEPGTRRGWTPPVERLFPELHAVLAETVGRLERGAGGLVVVAGEPGIGKGWALDAVRALHDGPALMGRASNATREIPLWPLHQTLSARMEDERVVAGRGSLDEINAVVDALTELGRQRPTVVGVHRIDCADSATLAVLETLAAHEVDGVLCVATVRSEPSTASHEFLDSLLEQDLAIRVDLRPVPDDAVREVVLQLLGGRSAPDDVVRRVVYLAGGLPRLAERIVRGAQRRGVLLARDGEWLLTGAMDAILPLEASAHVERSLAAAGAAERDVSVTAAVLGAASLVDLAEVTALDLDVLDDATHRGIELGLLRRVADAVVPRTGLVRDAILHGLVARTSTDVLDRLAAAASYSGTRSSGFDRAVEMLERVGMTGAAANYRLRMASRSLDEGHLGTAVEQLASVQLDQAAIADRIVHAGLRLRVAAVAGGGDEVDAAWRCLTATLPEVAATADVMLVRARAWRSISDAIALADTLPPRATPSADPAEAEGWLELLRALAAPTDERSSLLASGGERWSASPDVAVTAIRHRCARLGDEDPASIAAELDRARRLRATTVEVRRVAAASAQLELLRGGMPLALNSAAVALFEDGDRLVGGALLIDASLALAWTGRSARAATQLAEVVEATREAAPATAANALVARAAVAAVEGELDRVDGILDAAGALDPEPAANRAAQALAALVADDLGRVLAVWSPVEIDLGMTGVASTQWAWMERMLPLIQLVSGDPPSTAPDRWSWTSVAAGWDALVRAGRQGAIGDADGALRELAVGDEALASVPVQQLLGRRLVCELAVRDGWASRPIELTLRAALARCATTGLTALESRCRTLLRGGGYAVPRYGEGIAEVPIDLRSKGITTREMEVVRLLLDGASTAETAAALFISDATVKSHVSNAMRKLGYASRDELLEALASIASGS